MDDKIKDLTAYSNRFNEDPTSFNDYQAADYIKELKNQNRNEEAIEVGRTFLEQVPSLKRYINHFGYALYNKYINVDDAKIAENENVFYTILDEICNVCRQERYSPLEVSVNRAIKYVQNKEEVDYAKISSLLDLLDAPTLDDKPFVNKDGVEFESKKERWYRLKVRSLFEIKDFKNTITQANIALTMPFTWHYNNLNWIKYYRGCALVEVGRFNEAENEFLSLKDKFRAVNFSSILYKLYVNTDRKNDAYTYLINDFFLNGLDVKNIDNYKAILEMAKDKDQEKAISLVTSLINKLENKEDDSDLSVDDIFDKLYSEIMYHLDRYIEREEGKVVYYNNAKNFGSIYQEDDDNLFFRQADFIDNEDVRKYDVVEFSRINTFDTKKNQPSSKAILLTVLYEDIDY